MAKIDARKFLAGEARKLKSLRNNSRLAAAWLLGCLLAGCLLWTATLSILDHKQRRVWDEAQKTASALANASAIQLERTVEQIDQITLHLKYDWQATHGALQLEDQLRRGLYPHSAHLYVTIVDRDGKVLTSTLTKRSGVSAAARDYFQAHRAGQVKELLVSLPSVGLLSEKVMSRFSRRLDAEDGSFDGVVMAAIEPEYLVPAALADEPHLEARIFSAVSRVDGGFLAASAGGRTGPAANVFRADPVLKTSRGVTRMSAQEFIDGRPRIIAWRRLENYPLMAVVGLDAGDVYSRYQATERNYHLLAAGGSVALLLLAAAGLFFSARLAWRRQQAEEVENAYRLATDAAREGFYMLRPIYGKDGTIVDFMMRDCNERGAAYYGSTRALMIGRRFSDSLSGEQLASTVALYASAMETGYYEGEARVADENPLRPAWIHRRLARSGDGLAVTLRDISELKAHEEDLARMANTDAVTSLPNRHWLMHYLPTAIELARSKGAQLAVLFIDLDDFKNINDTLGHAAGDELLRTVASRLRSVLRPQDSVVRLGGDEFTVVLEHATSEWELAHAAESIVATLGAAVELAPGKSEAVLGSIGISVFPRDGDNSEALLKHADIAMYAAKAAGKGQYMFYMPEMSEALVVRLNKEQALRQAIERDEFVLYFQPLVDTFSGELRSLEALVRWISPGRGVVPPDEFIPLAEETGLIVPLGALVIKKACAQLAQWKAQQLPVVPVSINVSVRQFDQGKLSALFTICMAQYGIEPSLLEIEITETCMIGDEAAVAAELSALEALGVKLLVDDFGTGYSSLSQLQTLELDAVKVDRAFTARLDGGKDEAFYMAILSMAHVLDMAVVAEGVETVEQLRTLQALSCNQVQGYLISPPRPAAEIPALLTKRYLFPEVMPRVHSA